MVGTVAAVACLAGLATSQTTRRVSVYSSGVQAGAGSENPSISADGRFVAFESSESFVAGDPNGTNDVFVRDLLLGTTECASVDMAGVPGNIYSDLPSISGDGRYVAFFSFSSNLVSGDTNDQGDVFVRDRQNGTTVIASLDWTGAQVSDAFSGDFPAISADGRCVAFRSDSPSLVPGDTNGVTDIFVRDLTNGTTERVSVDSAGVEANGFSDWASISFDGRVVAFHSVASNLVPGDTNSFDVFVHDRLNGTTERVNLTSGGTQAGGGCEWPVLSADGTCVAFEAQAANLVPGDTNGKRDVFVRDLVHGTTERVSVDSSGLQANDQSQAVSISADGRFVAFQSWARNLVPGDSSPFTDVFVRDRQLGTTRRVSIATDGTQANGHSGDTDTSISADGRFIAFDSVATNLVTGDTNAAPDVFLHDRAPAAVIRFCFGDDSGAPCPCGNAGNPFRGCENSASTGGAVLDASGTASLGSDRLRMSSYGERPQALSLLFQGTTSIAAVNYGDGLRCVGGNLKRLFARNASLGVVTVPAEGDPSISARSAALGDPIPMGGSRFYHVQYRDPSTAYCPDPPGDSWNVSSALSVVWDP